MDLRLNVGTGWLIVVVFDVDVDLGVLFNVSLVFVWCKFWLAAVLCFFGWVWALVRLVLAWYGCFGVGCVGLGVRCFGLRGWLVFRV